jgi:hypothetical protein
MLNVFARAWAIYVDGSGERISTGTIRCKNLVEHLRDGEESAGLAQHQTLRLLQNAAEFENWVSIWNVDHYLGKKPAGKVPSPVYYASCLGLDLILSNLLAGCAILVCQQVVFLIPKRFLKIKIKKKQALAHTKIYLVN